MSDLAAHISQTRLIDASDPDLASRLKGVRNAWQRCRHTGYGEAVRLLARQVYDIAEIAELTPAQLEAAQARNHELRRPGVGRRCLPRIERGGGSCS